MYKAKLLSYIFVIVIIFSLVIIFYLYSQIQILNKLYQINKADINMSGWCINGTPTEVLYYGNNCPSCDQVYSAFMNTTSLFGLWQGNRFYSGYFCAYSINLTAYNLNQSSIFAPPGAINLFETLSDQRIPLLVFNGEYYKIGGFSNATEADTEILKYICLTLNNRASQCQ